MVGICSDDCFNIFEENGVFDSSKGEWRKPWARNSISNALGYWSDMVSIGYICYYISEYSNDLVGLDMKTEKVEIQLPMPKVKGDKHTVKIFEKEDRLYVTKMDKGSTVKVWILTEKKWMEIVSVYMKKFNSYSFWSCLVLWLGDALMFCKGIEILKYDTKSGMLHKSKVSGGDNFITYKLILHTWDYEGCQNDHFAAYKPTFYSEMSEDDH
ncbi:hypothetical protein AMTRI_Chr13g115960 [Amborella trichopoda]